MLPFSSRRSSTSLMSNLSYFASRTPSATFSKSQNSAMLTFSLDDAMCISIEAVVELDDSRHDSDSSEGEQRLWCIRTDRQVKKCGKRSSQRLHVSSATRGSDELRCSTSRELPARHRSI